MHPKRAPPEGFPAERMVEHFPQDNRRLIGFLANWQ